MEQYDPDSVEKADLECGQVDASWPNPYCETGARQGNIQSLKLPDNNPLPRVWLRGQGKIQAVQGFEMFSMSVLLQRMYCKHAHYSSIRCEFLASSVFSSHLFILSCSKRKGPEISIASKEHDLIYLGEVNGPHSTKCLLLSTAMLFQRTSSFLLCTNNQLSVSCIILNSENRSASSPGWTARQPNPGIGQFQLKLKWLCNGWLIIVVLAITTLLYWQKITHNIKY